jgi:maltose alpha-D-glucosyltransferase/alpha-amylase
MIKDSMSSSPLWYKNAIFYELNVRAFRDTTGDGNGDLQGAIEKLDYLSELGIDCIWLLPIFPSPLQDDGYDVSDYCDIHPDFGTIEDFKDLIREAHLRGIRVITDLVLNHTSDKHPWFIEARKKATSPYHDYYVWSDTDTKYSQARIIFNDSENSNWAWDAIAEKFYWHRFFSSQPDLNYDNPAVRQEMLDVMSFWLDLGIDGFRADAIPYLYEREDSNSENLEETHLFLKEARSFIDAHYPGRILLSEANQWPEDVLPYLGNGDEMHMAFHFPLMPRIFMALRQENGNPIRKILDRTPPIPENAQWCLFLRNHDELTLEMVTEDERDWMWQEYAPEERMRLNFGIRRRLAPLLDNNIDKIHLAYSLLFTLPGAPTIYYGDEIGMGDNIWLHDRNGVRTPMQWSAKKNAGFSETQPEKLYSPVIDKSGFAAKDVSVAKQLQSPDSLLQTVRRMIALRKEHEIFSSGNISWVQSDQYDAVLSYLRSSDTENVLVLNNLSSSEQNVEIALHALGDFQNAEDLLEGRKSLRVKDGKLEILLNAFGYVWLKLS